MKMVISVLMVTFFVENNIEVAAVLDQQVTKISQLFLYLQP